MNEPEYMRTDPSREALHRLQSRVNGLYILSVIVLAGILCSTVTLVIMSGSTASKKAGTWTAEQQRAFAVKLQTQGLYRQAADAFTDYLLYFDVPAAERASVCYTVGRIYCDRHAYEDALVYFSQAELADPSAAFMPELARLKITCLERLGRTADAQYALNKHTALKADSAEPSERSEVVAVIGSDEITLGDVHDELQQLPPQQQKQFSSAAMKAELLQQMVTHRLLADQGRKLGYDTAADFIAQCARFEDGLLVQKVFEREIAAKISIDNRDVRMYYDANKQEFTQPENVALSCIIFSSGTNAAATLQTLLKTPEEFAALKQKAAGDSRLIEARAFPDGYVAGLGSCPEMVNQALRHKAGLLTNIVKTARGHAIVHVARYQPSSTEPFESVKEEAEARYRQQKQQQALGQMLDELYKVNNVKLFTGRLTDNSPTASGTAGNEPGEAENR
jgi:peptidyl-prolyl cis-trans isomerase C